MVSREMVTVLIVLALILATHGQTNGKLPLIIQDSKLRRSFNYSENPVLCTTCSCTKVSANLPNCTPNQALDTVNCNFTCEITQDSKLRTCYLFNYSDDTSTMYYLLMY